MSNPGTGWLHVHRARRDAEDSQPWRCAACNKAVRPHLNDPCDCTRALEAWPVGTRCRTPDGCIREVTGHLLLTEGPRVEARLVGSSRISEVFTVEQLRKAEG